MQNFDILKASILNIILITNDTKNRSFHRHNLILKKTEIKRIQIVSKSPKVFFFKFIKFTAIRYEFRLSFFFVSFLSRNK